MNRIALAGRAALLPVAVLLTALFFLGCNPKDEYRYFRIRVDSLEVSPSVPVGSDIVVRPFGTIGPDGSYSFDRFEADHSRLLLDLTVWGKQDLGPGAFPEIVIGIDTAYRFRAQQAGTQVIRIRRPDGGILEDTCAVV